MHTQYAVCAPVALQTPHTVHSSSGLLSAFCVAILFYILVDLFFYGSSKSMLKICLFMSLYTVCNKLLPSCDYYYYYYYYYYCICLFIIKLWVYRMAEPNTEELKNDPKAQSEELVGRPSFYPFP